MFRGFGGINPKAQEDFNKARETCIEHPECKGCPMISGKPLEIEDRQVLCETGRNKREDD